MANPWLPRYGDPAVRYDSGWVYPTEAEILAAKTQPTLKGPMRRQTYFPPRTADQIPWLDNFGGKAAGYQAGLTLPAADVTAAVASCKFLVYVLSQWLPAARALGPAATSAVDLLFNGTGPDPVALPTFTAPALPAGVAPVPPGALNRIFNLVQIIKKSTGYTETIGNDLDIIGSEDTTDPSTMKPVLKLTLDAGRPNVGWKKQGMDGIEIEVDRGSGFVFLAIDTIPGYLDTAPLPAAGTSAVWKYRAIYRLNDERVGQWSDIASIGVMGG